MNIFVDLMIDHIMFFDDGQEMAEFLYESSYFGIFCLAKLDSCILNWNDFKAFSLKMVSPSLAHWYFPHVMG